MKPRGSVSLLGVAIGVLSVAMAGHPALAQVAFQPAAQGTGLGDLLADPGKWATTMFNAALIGLGQKTTSDVVGFMGWLLGNGNLISQTRPGCRMTTKPCAGYGATCKRSATQAWRW